MLSYKTTNHRMIRHDAATQPPAAYIRPRTPLQVPQTADPLQDPVQNQTHHRPRRIRRASARAVALLEFGKRQIFQQRPDSQRRLQSRRLEVLVQPHLVDQDQARIRRLKLHTRCQQRLGDRRCHLRLAFHVRKQRGLIARIQYPDPLSDLLDHHHVAPSPLLFSNFTLPWPVGTFYDTLLWVVEKDSCQPEPTVSAF